MVRRHHAEKTSDQKHIFKLRVGPAVHNSGVLHEHLRRTAESVIFVTGKT